MAVEKAVEERVSFDEWEAGELSVEYDDQEPQEVLRWALETFAPERVAVCTSFQADGMAILGGSTHGGLAISADGTTWRALDAEGNAPGSKTPMEWGYMQPAWLVPDGLLAIGLDAHGGPTRRLMLAAATASTAPAGSGSP